MMQQNHHEYHHSTGTAIVYLLEILNVFIRNYSPDSIYELPFVGKLKHLHMTRVSWNLVGSRGP